MRLQAVEMTRNNRAWKSQVRDSHIPTAVDGEHVASRQQHTRITLRAASVLTSRHCCTFPCIKSAAVILSRYLRFQHTERSLEDSIKLAIDPANHLIEICTAKDDVLRPSSRERAASDVVLRGLVSRATKT